MQKQVSPTPYRSVAKPWSFVAVIAREAVPAEHGIYTCGCYEAEYKQVQDSQRVQPDDLVILGQEKL